MPQILPIEAYYEAAQSGPSTDISQHLPLLKLLAEECVRTCRHLGEPTGGHVTEIGMRWASGSTVAFLAAKPAQLVSWELEPLHVVHQSVLDLLRAVALNPDGTGKPPGQTRWQPRAGNSLEVVFEATDMIFFDSLHTASHLLKELMRHGDRSRKFLVFHDTESFGSVGEDGKAPGLRAAINRFQKEYFPVWRKVVDVSWNNGLVVLQRESDFERHPWRSFWTCGEGDPEQVGAPGPV